MYLTRRAFLRSCGITGAACACMVTLGACSAQGEGDPPARKLAKSIVAGMSIEERVAQLFVVTPEQLCKKDSVINADESMRDALVAMPVGGIIFFGNNLQETRQTREMLEAIKGYARDEGVIPPFLCVDEEGGMVQRIGGNAGFGAPFIDHAANIGATQDKAMARAAADSIASSLLDLGFNTNFAPSCDVSSGLASAMHKRSFSTDAYTVASMAAEEIFAFNEHGLLCCAKHFPGIGEPEHDSHDGPIASAKTREELEMQLLPFRAAIDVGVPFVMVGHLALPAITGSAVPATLSPEIVQGMLREELGFEGIVITDSLSMGAVGAYASPANVAIMALEAGCDIALMPADFDAAYAGLLDAVNAGTLSEARIGESLTRIIEAKLGAMPDQFTEGIQKQLGR